MLPVASPGKNYNFPSHERNETFFSSPEETAGESHFLPDCSKNYKDGEEKTSLRKVVKGMKREGEGEKKF